MISNFLPLRCFFEAALLGRCNRGFTLIEMIAVLVLLSIVSVFGSLFLVNMVRSYQISEENTNLSQKSQLALTRIAVEISHADKIFERDDIIEFEIIDPEEGPQAVSFSIGKDGETLVYTRDETDFTLADRVKKFTVEYPDNESGYFIVTLELTVSFSGDAHRKFTKTIALP